jgi:DNA end-binding protein Ku
MMDLINKKVEGQEITIQPEAPAGKVIDLMAALKASLGMAKDADADRKPAIAADAPAAAEAAAAPKKKTASKKK